MEVLWREVKLLVSLKGRVLILDDTTLDKFYTEEIEVVTYHWRGKHYQVVKGINLITILWVDTDSDGDERP